MGLKKFFFLEKSFLTSVDRCIRAVQNLDIVNVLMIRIAGRCFSLQNRFRGRHHFLAQRTTFSAMMRMVQRLHASVTRCLICSNVREKLCFLFAYDKAQQRTVLIHNKQDFYYSNRDTCELRHLPTSLTARLQEHVEALASGFRLGMAGGVACEGRETRDRIRSAGSDYRRRAAERWTNVESKSYRCNTVTVKSERCGWYLSYR